MELSIIWRVYTMTEKRGAIIARLKRLPVTLSEEEQKELLAVPKTRYPTGERNHVMFEADAQHRPTLV